MLSVELPLSIETGKLQVMHLKRYWQKSIFKRDGKLEPGSFHDEWKTDTTLLTVLGLGLEQTMVYVYCEKPSFEQFENWIVETNGLPDAEKVKQFNQLISNKNTVSNDQEWQYELLTTEDLDFWDENGYVIIKEAVSKECCEQAVEALCNFIEIDRYDPATWYEDHPARQGIMVQFFQHPALDQNRKADKVRKAFQDIWKRSDIWVNTDRAGFNAPETERHKFRGPRLHWDVSIKQPVPFGTQGILYLADTAENQGAFTLVPGFQNKIGEWMQNLPAGANPRQADLYALGPKPIAANAGDLIIWHQALPHGSSPNTSTLPRFVQYINYEPIDKQESEVWI
jgi:hypothetical protein